MQVSGGIMFVVAIYGWQEETPELVQALADALGIVAFEARQRLIGGGPAVVASFAERSQAEALAEKVIRSGIATLLVDAAAVRNRTGDSNVRRFEFAGETLQVETGSGQQLAIPYGEIDLLVAGMSIVGQSEIKTVTERKFSLGKTVLAGGIPMSSKVERLEEVTTEERGRVLYLRSGSRPAIVCAQNIMSYAGLGAEMKLSRELNFAYFLSQLRLRSPGAVYDERLLNRVSQVRLLGPAQHQEAGLDLAAEILALSLCSALK
jgi:hypothetical protein